jgi:hypothetical protein
MRLNKMLTVGMAIAVTFATSCSRGERVVREERSAKPASEPVGGFDASPRADSEPVPELAEDSPPEPELAPSVKSLGFEVDGPRPKANDETEDERLEALSEELQQIQERVAAAGANAEVQAVLSTHDTRIDEVIASRGRASE